MTDLRKALAPDDAHLRKLWRSRVLPELRVRCWLHMSERLAGKSRWACAWRDSKGIFHIAIHPCLPYEFALYLLIHELAHIDAIMAGAIDHDDHGPIWGASFQTWYQIVHRTA
jgi:hypothetical protein